MLEIHTEFFIGKMVYLKFALKYLRKKCVWEWEKDKTRLESTDN